MSDGRRPRGDPLGGVDRKVAAAAVMALTIVAGVGLVLVLPQPRPPSPVELARPAPVAQAPLPDWAAPPPPQAAVRESAPLTPTPQPPAAAKPAPPLRGRRLAEAQVSRPHAARLPQIVATPTSKAPRPAACRAPASVADRLVCGRPGLASMDVAMRHAYDQALKAGADRLAIDRAQAQWRGQRDRATSEAELSRLYARRIAELDDAARRSERHKIYG